MSNLAVIAKVNGIVARFQAYTHVAALMTDCPDSPDDENKQPQLMPYGFARRKDD